MLVTVRTLSLILAAVLVVSACGSSPPVRYYALSTTSVAMPDDPADAEILGLGPLNVPEYLNRSQIVTRGSGAEIVVDEFSHWAEPLGVALHRVVAADIDSMLSDLVVIPFPYDSVIRNDVDYRLLGEVDRFDADRSGNVTFDIQWTVIRPGDRMLLPPRRSRYQAQAARPDDPASVVAAMNDTLRQFSRDVADHVATVLREQ